MALEVKITCPLGHKCENAVDGKIERCAWYVEMEGQDPQNGELLREWRCAIAWQPILMVEQARQTRSVAAATESFRNEMVNASAVSNQLMLEAVERSKPEPHPAMPTWKDVQSLPVIKS